MKKFRVILASLLFVLATVILHVGAKISDEAAHHFWRGVMEGLEK